MVEWFGPNTGKQLIPGLNVLEAAQQRIAWTFDHFQRVYISFSGGKDSTVMLHLAMAEAIKRGRKVGVLFVDLEGQYKLTIEHVEACYALYADHIEPHWVALPLNLRNAVSVIEPQWLCWDPDREADWIRRPSPLAVTDETAYPFFRRGMEFEEFVPEFGRWYGRRQRTACLVGIRTDESLNRWRSISWGAQGRKRMASGKSWTTLVTGHSADKVYNVYPIYDWRTEDLWTYHGRNPDLPYNHLYDRMHQAGLTLHQMRICQPYGDDQRRGLWLFHLIEPETWARVVARVEGANSGALYARESGNILGMRRISKPEGHTWQSYAEYLLTTMPPATEEHYRDKIAGFLHWYESRGYPDGIADDGPLDKQHPSWMRICKMLLRNDYWAKGLSFSQHKTSASYERYREVMKNRRKRWGIYA